MSRITKTDMTRNLEAFWTGVDEIDMASGMKAYRTYHDTLRTFASHYGVGFVPTVEAFVLLSPNNDYHGNLRSLASVLDAWVCGRGAEGAVVTTFKRMRDKAYGVIDGEISFLDSVKGNKITCFRDNILYLEASKRATIDGHMVSILSGKDLNMRMANFELRKAPYPHWEGSVTRFAKRHDVSPCQMQAALWMCRKRTQSIRFSTQQELFADGSAWDAVLDPKDFPPYAPGEASSPSEGTPESPVIDDLFAMIG